MSTDPQYYLDKLGSSSPQTLELVPVSIGRSLVNKGNKFLTFTDNLRPPGQSVARVYSSEKQSLTVAPLHSDGVAATSTTKASSSAGLSSPAAMVSESVEAVTTEKTGRNKHPDSGQTAFVRFEDPIPQAHPRGEYPERWPNEAHPGRILIARIRQLFSVIPSELWCSAVTVIVDD